MGAMVTHPYSKEFLESLLWGSNQSSVVYDKIVGQSRWHVNHDLLFQTTEGFFLTHYRSPATEEQDDGYWESLKPGEMVECAKCEQATETTVVYRVIYRP